MRIIIDIGHPAHVHYFKNFIKIMERKGHQILVTAREKEITHTLLNHYGIHFIGRGAGGNNIFSKIGYLFYADLLLLKCALGFKPDIFLSFSSPYAAQMAKFLGKPHIAFDDTENAKLSHMFSRPFSTAILTPSCYRGDSFKKQIKFNGYMELCYLHRKYFTPDPSVLDLLGVEKGEKYVIMRFVSRKAVHDIGHGGYKLEMKRKAVEEISKYAKVFISSEKELPEDLKSYEIRIPPEKMHDALAYATLLFGESATMASECAVLGTPAIFLDHIGRGYTDEEEQTYHLIFNFTESMKDQELSIQKSLELLKDSNIKKEWQARQMKMLADKIHVTAFMVWFIENYPESVTIMQNNPDYQFPESVTLI